MVVFLLAATGGLLFGSVSAYNYRICLVVLFLLATTGYVCCAAICFCLQLWSCVLFCNVSAVTAVCIQIQELRTVPV